MAGITHAQIEASVNDRLYHLAGRSAYASGVVSALGVALLAAMFAVRGPFGKLNDICVILQYLLALPIPLALHRLLGARSPGLSRVAMALGITGMLGIIVLQILLVADVMPFEQQVWYVTFFMLVVLGSWLGITAYLARSSGMLPQSGLMSLLAWSYVAYPVWAFWIGRQLAKEGLRSGYATE